MVPDQAHWRAWLDENEDLSGGVWLTLAKKGRVGATTLVYAEALDEALCSGWIDGQAKRVDADSYLQRFTPRRARSIWSSRNVGYVTRLVEEGRMRPRGQVEIDKAKADGRWEVAYEGPAKAEVPEEFKAALAASPKASATFDSLSSQNRYAILFRLATAKKAETKIRNIAKFVEMLERGETIYPQKRKD